MFTILMLLAGAVQQLGRDIWSCLPAIAAATMIAAGVVATYSWLAWMGF